MNRNKTIIGIIIICIDQLTKNLVQVFDADVNIINNFLRIKYVQNTGAAFSMFKGYTTILILVSIVLLVLVYNLMFSYKETKLNNLSFGLIIGGIIGNLIDRIFFQCADRRIYGCCRGSLHHLVRHQPGSGNHQPASGRSPGWRTGETD